MITDLSFPKGSSVNDGIDPSLCSLMYTSVDEAVRKGLECGKGSLMAKMDIRSAYRTIPVHPDDRHLLGMSWNDLSFAIWLKIGTKNLQRSSRCTAMDFQGSGHKGITTLPGRLPVHRCGWYPGVPASS